MNRRRVIFFILIIALSIFLRLWRLSEVPVSLFGDELDVGYHAYSILKTGKDYTGEPWPLHFRSLAEWRTPLYLYSAVPSVYAFGISPLGVRLPAAFFGVLSIVAFYLMIRKLTDNEIVALCSSFFMTISPWHIQYSRAGFEVTQLLFFLIFGFYLFLKSLDDGRYLWLSAIFFALTPWIYSTAKFFTPFILFFIFVLWRKEILKMRLKHLVWAVASFLLIGGPIAYSTLFGGGSQRFSYISVFTDPTIEQEIGFARTNDALVRGYGFTPTFLDRYFHNKFFFWGKNILNNYFQAFSTDFLFNRGDPNLRHSIEGMGQLYKVDVIILVLGLVVFFAKYKSRRVRVFIALWILLGVVPSAITREGGNHATRLIITLPIYIFLMSFGFWFLWKHSKLLTLLYSLLLFLSFIFYQHNYWIHNPWYSERWWHAGWRDGIAAVVDNEKNYDRVVITSADEPPWVFFAAWFEYPPDRWQREFPIGNDVDLAGFGRVSHIDKYYFGSPEVAGVYSWGQVLDSETLYLASAKEVNVNLIREPERTPSDLILISSIAYPSGEPAFYLFSGRDKQ